MEQQEQPLVALVILNWNGRHHLEQFLPSVLLSGYPALQVIVADNASTDDSIFFLQHHYPEVQLLKLAQNHGFARGYNEALRQVFLISTGLASVTILGALGLEWRSVKKGKVVGQKDGDKDVEKEAPSSSAS